MRRGRNPLDRLRALARAEVSLDGLRVEVCLSPPRAPADALQSLVQEVERLCREHPKLVEWEVQTELCADSRVRLRARRLDSRFVALICTLGPGVEGEAELANALLVELSGVANLSRLVFGLAGGAPGVRSRVVETLSRRLSGHFEGT